MGGDVRQRWQALRGRDALVGLDQAFLASLQGDAPELAERLLAYRAAPLEGAALSALLLDLAPRLEAFIAAEFGLEDALAAARAAILDEAVVLEFKQQYVLRRARRYRGEIALGFEALDRWLDDQTGAADTDRERAIARLGMDWLGEADARAEAIDRLTQWCVLAINDPAGQRAVSGWTSFRLPQRVDHAHLVPLQPVPDDHLRRLQSPPEDWRRRDGFALTDPRMSCRQVQGEVHYCVYCHEHEGDFCSRGFPEKKGQPALGYKTDPLGVTLTGCPLGEKISEMHVLRRAGQPLAALAMVMVDNPMLPATGHRICNDCMKACIYQKQDPVDIPQIETRTLTDVLALPWGVEIYDLLARWNPLRRRQYLPRPYRGQKVLVAGLGPAGFTMAHHLTMEGLAVVGVDGLKIEPLPEALLSEPVRDWQTLVEDLDERVTLGFGGVAEYGITVRWDKNFLKLIYLTLARRTGFQAFGGVRLGGTLTLEDAWSLGFDHVCVATGAGLPRVLAVPNSLARGMRQASDFLMALQLTGAGRRSSLANLQLRLPAVVIGGGLTAVDTATEVQAHYLRQVEKVLDRHRRLVAQGGEAGARAGLSAEDAATLDEFLAHGEAVERERARAAAAGEAPDFIPLLRGWGGVTLTYRKGMNASPAYTRNHEELRLAMAEGLYYAEGLDPLRVEVDASGHVAALVCRRMRCEEGRWLGTSEEVALPARSVFVAAGALPNTIYAREHAGSLSVEGDHFQPHVAHADGLQPVQVAAHCKAEEFGPFARYAGDGARVSFIGDTHPVFHGSVVKAIASAQRSYPELIAALPATRAGVADDREAFAARMRRLLTAQVAEVRRDNPAVVEVWVEAPLAARNFRPGQFFRLQTYEALSPMVEGTRLQVPVLTVSGTGVEGDRIRLQVLQWGAAPRLVGRLQPGDPVVLMGPTGSATPIPDGETVMVIAGRWGAAVMLDIGPALRAAGNRVLYVAAFGRADELDHQAELEAGADQIIWCTANGPLIEARRPQDVSVAASDMVALVRSYAADGVVTDPLLPLASVQRLMVMGSTGLLAGFQQALAGDLAALFAPGLRATGTVGSPMQCMLKGVCAQCLQWQIDPDTGRRTRAVFSCAEQDQPLAWIDLENLSARQAQNRLLDRQTAQWLDYLLSGAARA